MSRCLRTKHDTQMNMRARENERDQTKHDGFLSNSESVKNWI